MPIPRYTASCGWVGDERREHYRRGCWFRASPPLPPTRRNRRNVGGLKVPSPFAKQHDEAAACAPGKNNQILVAVFVNPPPT